MYLFIPGILSLVTAWSVVAETIKFDRSAITPTTDTIHVRIDLDPDQALRENSISFSVNHPDFTITSWEADRNPAHYFDKKSKETHTGYIDMVNFTIQLEHPAADSAVPADLFMHYVTNTHNQPQEKRFNLSAPNAPEDALSDQPSTTASPSQRAPASFATPGIWQSLQNVWQSLVAFLTRLKEHTMLLVTTTDSRLIQFIFALILGVFMSLTPCIYPMIPITVGILGTSTQNTLWRNFLLAFSYACGLATTFALLGLLAAFFGTQSGQILANPWFVAILVAVLAYLGLSTIGLYEMWIPRFMQPKNQAIKRGSFMSAFFFGMASGTIASPCMSPGLALILTIVAGMGNIFVGFLLLFVFGIGASMPLLIIGTFSASLHVLPKAGMWMVEFKKVFGFMLLGMCFYYLKNILPTTLAYAAPALFLVIVGGYYLSRVAHYKSTSGKLVAFLLGVALFTAAGYLAFKAYTTASGQETSNTHGWRSDYQQAQVDAQQQNQLMLLDFGASWCSACNQLEKKVLHQPELTQLFDQVVAVRIDGSKQGAEPYNTLIKQYNLRGIPAVILTDAHGAVIKQWGGELAGRTPAAFAKELATYLK